MAFGFLFAQDGAPKRPKIAPRRDQDRLGSLFWPLAFSLRFWIVFGSVLVPFWPPKWSPGGAHEPRLRPLGWVQDGLGIVLVRSFFRLAVWLRFLVAFGCLLVPFGGALGVVLGLLEGFLGSFWRFWMHFDAFGGRKKASTRRFNP